VATVGPACQSPAMLCKLIKEGVNVFRLNFSHGSHEEHSAILQNIRDASKSTGIAVAVLQDLAGPKIRISNVAEQYVSIKDGDQIDLYPADGSFSTAQRINIEAVNPIKILKKGHNLLLADGAIELKTVAVEQDHVKCIIVKGGRMRSRAGISFPDSNITLPATTDQDLVDLDWAVQNKLDYVAISFVMRASDIVDLRRRIEASGSDIKLIAKIERKDALENIFEIMAVSDGVMVARGDLGLEVAIEQVPLLQKSLIEEANFRGIPVIVATQMLHSMITAVRPTRAEVSDIATAVMTGADAVMLSEETAIGEHPVEAVRYLGKIALAAEEAFVFEEYKLRLRNSDSATVSDAVAYAAAAAAIKVDAAAIIACTQTGTSARLLAKYRPRQPVYGVSSNEAALRRMCLYWGIFPISCAVTDTHFDELNSALKAVQMKQDLPNGSRAVITGGLSVGQAGSTSILEIREMSFK